MDWLPEHKCGLYLEHNAHKDVYETILEYYDQNDFISKDELKKALETDNVWYLHWYPDTPIGFYKIAASSLEAIQKELKENNYA